MRPPSERTTLRRYVSLEELKSIKNSKGDPGQMATISECRYRWLRVYDLDLQRGHPGRRWIAHERRLLADNQAATSRVGLPSEKKTGFLRMHRSCDTG
jgi:hypothetical protein